VAERYALVYPNRVARLVLDSVVPQQGIDLLPLTTFKATTRVLRSVCAAERCGSDPARDLQAIVLARGNGIPPAPQLLDAITSMSIGHATFSGLLPALHAARAGRYAALDAIVRRERSAAAATAGELSQGLHESTLCMDLPRPYLPTAPRSQRAATIRGLVSQVPTTALFPFDRATALHFGVTENCLDWPATVPPAVPAGDGAAKLPRVPVLLLAGNRDLSTPLAWAQKEAAMAPRGRLVVVPDTGHSVQTTKGSAIWPDLRRFLHSV
jgi:pimeloyl-ACP methyl ester carboxylesterase